MTQGILLSEEMAKTVERFKRSCQAPNLLAA